MENSRHLTAALFLQTIPANKPVTEAKIQLTPFKV